MEHSITNHTVPRETYIATLELYQKHKLGLESYIDELLWWNNRINLVSRDVSRETISEHIRHSLLLTQLTAFQSSKNVVDSGTGGGLPGVPLAITTSEKHFLLNDVVSKKILAIKQITKKLNLKNIDTFNQSIENLNWADPFLLVSKHAFKIADLLKYTANMPWTSIIMYKGLSIENELQKLKEPIQLDIYDLSDLGQSNFYEGKSIIHISR